MQQIFKFNETSPAAAGTAASSSPVTGSNGVAGILQSANSLEGFQSLFVVATIVGATGGTLDVYLQTSPDQGATWVDYAHFPQRAAGAASITYAFPVAQGTQIVVPIVVGVNASPALAANTVVGGSWGDRMRLLMVAGAGTSAGGSVTVYVSATRPN